MFCLEKINLLTIYIFILEETGVQVGAQCTIFPR